MGFLTQAKKIDALTDIDNLKAAVEIAAPDIGSEELPRIVVAQNDYTVTADSHLYIDYSFMSPTIRLPMDNSVKKVIVEVTQSTFGEPKVLNNVAQTVIKTLFRGSYGEFNFDGTNWVFTSFVKHEKTIQRILGYEFDDNHTSITNQTTSYRNCFERGVKYIKYQSNTNEFRFNFKGGNRWCAFAPMDGTEEIPVRIRFQADTSTSTFGTLYFPDGIPYGIDIYWQHDTTNGGYKALINVGGRIFITPHLNTTITYNREWFDYALKEFTNHNGYDRTEVVTTTNSGYTITINNSKIIVHNDTTELPFLYIGEGIDRFTVVDGKGNFGTYFCTVYFGADATADYAKLNVNGDNVTFYKVDGVWNMINNRG